MTAATSIRDVLWPVEELHECLPMLFRASGWPCDAAVNLHPAARDVDADGWIHRGAARLGFESERLAGAYGDLEQELASCFPGVLVLGDGFLAIAGQRRGQLRVVGRQGEEIELSIQTVAQEMRRPAEGGRRDTVERLLNRCEVRPDKRQRAADLLLQDQWGNKRVHYGWIFRQSCTGPVAPWLRQVGAVRHSAALLLFHSLAYAVWLVAWGLLGSLSFRGQMDHGWIVGWSLLIAVFVFCRVLGSWHQGRIAVGIGGLLKRRLLQGVLRLQPEEIKRQGIGSFLGQTFEAEAIETLALGGGIASLLAIVDLCLSGFVLGTAALLLCLWFGIAVFLGWRFLVRYEQWTGNRIGMTQDLVESMVGHRTRLVQQPAEHWHDAEDKALEDYFVHSTSVDRVGATLLAWIPRGWLLIGLSYLAHAVITIRFSGSQTAVLLGGVLLAWSAFERFVGSLTDMIGAYVAWKRIGYLFCAAARPEQNGNVSVGQASQSTKVVLEADRLTFRYRPTGTAVLDGCGLTVNSGDRVILEGPSGGGKTTLASILAGAKVPESGLLLAGGLDMQTLGREGWRRYVTLVPQFHENHILTETLAFNLLVGRMWPPTQADMREAEYVCQRLGLGPVLDRMPNRLLQMVGEGGWQLSHGEKSRIFMARALLQNAKLTILDESFGALDPENLQMALEFTLERADSLLVIAHP